MPRATDTIDAIDGIDGVGLGLRWSFGHAASVAPLPPCLRFFEVTPENHLGLGGARKRHLEAIRGRRPMLSHGVSGNLGGVDPLDPARLARLREFLKGLGIESHSDHLCWTAHLGLQLHELLPLLPGARSATRTAERIRATRDALGVPVAVENVTAYWSPTNVEDRKGRMDPSIDAAFVREVCERAECGLLLDVHNLWVNARNHEFDPMDWLHAMPIERVTQLHVAGGRVRADLEGLFVDDHSALVPTAVVELMQWVVERTGPLPVCYERDNDIPELGALLAEVERLDTAYRAACGRVTPTASRTVVPATGPEPESESVEREPRWLAEFVDSLIGQELPGDRRRVYRAMVRETLAFAPTRLLPRTRAALGEAFSSSIAGWIERPGPRSPILRELVLELAAWLEARLAAAPAAEVTPSPVLPSTLPPWSTALLRYEVARHSVRIAPDPGLAVDPDRDPTLEACLAFAPATIVELEYDVRQDPPSPAPVDLLIWRAADAREDAIRTVALSRFERRAIVALLGGAPLRTALVEANEGREPIPDARLRSMAERIAALAHDGCVLGVVVDAG